MTALIAILLTLVALAGSAVVWTAEPERQAVTQSVFGMLLVALFLVVQAPGVALSELAVGAALIPLMIMLTIRKTRRGK